MAPPPSPRTRPLVQLTRTAGIALEVLAYLFWLGLDALLAFGLRATDGVSLVGAMSTPVSGAAVAGLVLLRRFTALPVERIALAAALSSLSITAMSALLGAPLMSFTEQLALAVVTVAALRRAADRQALLLCAGALLAIVSSPLVRLVQVPKLLPTFVFLSALGWGGTIAIGLALRELWARRAAQLADARVAERMELARELHDVVAHQVTGIVVAAQAAKVVARTAPEEVDRALAAIEHAGTDALTAMRRMVGVLRGGQDGDAARTPGAELREIPELVRRFDPGGELVRLLTDPGFEHAVLPAGAAATGYRVVQEALTNVRRHAPEASAVEVEIRLRDGELRVEVRNDGVRAGGVTIGGDGGFGLAGMAERVDALGGTLQAGPTGPGTWTVVARLPLGAAR